MSNDRKQEIESVLARYVAQRVLCEQGEQRWSSLAEFFTDDATFTDPAWGRIEGIEAIREFLDSSMGGLEGWSFPHEWTIIEGDRVVSAWQNRFPGQRADGSHYQAQGISVMLYAGDGKFRSEQDLLNMEHVYELMTESGWIPGPDVQMPPADRKR